MHFHYCPDCGTKLDHRELGDEGFVPWCPRCSRPWFDQFATCIIALAEDGSGDVVLLRQNYISNQYHNLVSGYMKPGETAEETACREIEEEIGLSVTALTPAGTYWYAPKDMLMLGFFARVKRAEPICSDEVDLAEWVSAEQALGLVHPNGSVSYQMVARYLAQQNQQ